MLRTLQAGSSQRLSLSAGEWPTQAYKPFFQVSSSRRETCSANSPPSLLGFLPTSSLFSSSTTSPVASPFLLHGPPRLPLLPIRPDLAPISPVGPGPSDRPGESPQSRRQSQWPLPIANVGGNGLRRAPGQRLAPPPQYCAQYRTRPPLLNRLETTLGSTGKFFARASTLTPEAVLNGKKVSIAGGNTRRPTSEEGIDSRPSTISSLPLDGRIFPTGAKRSNGKRGLLDDGEDDEHLERFLTKTLTTNLRRRTLTRPNRSGRSPTRPDGGNVVSRPALTRSSPAAISRVCYTTTLRTLYRFRRSDA